MTEHLLISRQRTALQELYDLIAERARREPQIEAEFKARNEAAEKWFQESCHRVISRFEEEKLASQKEFDDTQERVTKRFKGERCPDKEWKEAQARITGKFDSDSQAARANSRQRVRRAPKASRQPRPGARALREAQEKITQT